MVGGNLLKSLPAADRFHGDLGFELWAMGSSVAHRWEALGWGGAPPQRLTMDPVQKSQTSSQQARASMMLEGIPEENTPELFVAPGLDGDGLTLVSLKPS